VVCLSYLGLEPVDELTTYICDIRQCDTISIVTFPAAGHHGLLQSKVFVLLVQRCHFSRISKSTWFVLLFVPVLCDLSLDDMSDKKDVLLLITSLNVDKFLKFFHQLTE